MNWAAFFQVIGVGGLFAAVVLALDSRKRASATIFAIAIFLLAIAAGLEGK